MGLSYFENNEMSQAEHQFNLAIAEQRKLLEKEDSQENKENLSFYYKNKGLAIYHQAGADNLEKLDEAKAAFEEAIALHRSNADNYFNLGNVYLSENEPNFEMAHLNFKEALKLEPGNAKLYHARGLAF